MSTRPADTRAARRARLIDEWVREGVHLTDEQLADFLDAHGLTRLADALRHPDTPPPTKHPFRPCPDCSGLGGCAYGDCNA